jgi:outer membrane protein OmpA-like peptidoglycan-associated protein
MRRVVLYGCLAGLAATLSAAHPARAQVLKQIKESTAKKVEARKERLDSTVVRTAGQVVDSTLEKTNRGADAVVGKVGSAIDTAVSKTERGIASAFAGGDDDEDRLAAMLKTGRAVLRDVEFAAGSDTVPERAGGTLRGLAGALKEVAGTFLIEAHTEPGGDPAAAQALSERRAASVKAKLIELGIPAERLFAIGHGASRPAQDGSAGTPTSHARIEVARMQ